MIVSTDVLRMLFGTLIPVTPDEEVVSLEYKNGILTYVLKDIIEQPEPPAHKVEATFF